MASPVVFDVDYFDSDNQFLYEEKTSGVGTVFVVNGSKGGFHYTYNKSVTAQVKKEIEELVNALDKSWIPIYKRFFAKMQKHRLYKDKPVEAFRKFKLIKM